MHPGSYKTYTIKEAITVVVAHTRNLVVLVEEIGKVMKLKNKKLRISDGVQCTDFFLFKDIGSVCQSTLSLDPPARKTTLKQI